MTELTCPICGGKNVSLVADVGVMPAHVGMLWPTRESAMECPRGVMTLSLCGTCGYLFNSTFDAGTVDYAHSYDNALHHSGVFKEYEGALARRLISRYELNGKLLMEVGCGPAHFLGLLCTLGDNRGIGFDPSHDPDFLDPLAVGRVEVRKEYFGAEPESVEVDFFCARHVLEHIEKPKAFLETIHTTLAGSGAIAYIEVPNAMLALGQLSIWDLMYEHCGYYTVGSLTRLMRRCGFEVIEARSVYDDQFVGIEAALGSRYESASIPDEEYETLAETVAGFSDGFDETRRTWNHRLGQLAATGQSAVVWGAGGKGVGFMNLLSRTDAIRSVVDVNPRKQGTFMAGTGHEIVPPERLTDDPPDTVIVVNPVYRDEIVATLLSLGLEDITVEVV